VTCSNIVKVRWKFLSHVHRKFPWESVSQWVFICQSCHKINRGVVFLKCGLYMAHTQHNHCSAISVVYLGESFESWDHNFRDCWRGNFYLLVSDYPSWFLTSNGRSLKAVVINTGSWEHACMNMLSYLYIVTRDCCCALFFSSAVIVCGEKRCILTQLASHLRHHINWVFLVCSLMPVMTILSPRWAIIYAFIGCTWLDCVSVCTHSQQSWWKAL